MRKLKKPRLGVIYVLYCRPTSKKYVGQSVEPVRRWNEHWKCTVVTKKLKYPVERALKRYGYGAFFFDIVEFQREGPALDEAEVRWIKGLHALHPVGYNLAPGGRRGGTGKHTKGSRAKLSKVATKQWSDETSRAVILAGVQSFDHTPGKEQRAKISASLKKTYKKLRKLGADTNPRNTGKKASEETRLKMAESGERAWAAKSKEEMDRVSAKRSADVIAYYDRKGRKPKHVPTQSDKARANKSRAAIERWGSKTTEERAAISAKGQATRTANAARKQVINA